MSLSLGPSQPSVGRAVGQRDDVGEQALLRHQEVAPYLMRRNLIHPESIVECDLLIVDASRRNRNFRVVSERGPSYLLKQGIGPGGAATVANEATLLHSLQTDKRLSSLQRYLPRCHGYDADRGILALDLFRNSESFREYHGRLGRFPESLAKQLGGALGVLHRAAPVADGPGIAKRPAWVLSLHRPDVSVFRDISAANLQLIKLLQSSDEFCRLLDELRAGWANDAIIHGDVKGDNVVAFAHGTSRRRTRLALVDWEMAGQGDACWDVGAVFGEYLATWLLSMPITGEAAPDRFVELARYPLEAIQPAIRAFWHAYVRRMGFDVTTSHRRLVRSVQYSAARLLQTCYESSQTSTHLMGTTRCMLQLSLNVLQRSVEASVHLLGIQLSGAEAA